MDYTTLIFLLGLFPLSAMISLLDRSAEYKNMIIILTSLIFFSWGRPFAVCLIFLSVLIDWGLGLGAAKLQDKTGRKLSALPAVIVSGAVNSGLFLVFEHNSLFEGHDRLTLDKAIIPVGMAYYTIRGFSYVYDVFKGKIRAEKNVFCLFTYMMSFTLMCAGPAVRYGDMESQIRNREVTTEKLNQGLNRIFWGLAKAVLLTTVFKQIEYVGLSGSEITTMGCWLGMLAFFAKNYYLFTGLCDMSTGLSLVYGFVLPVNYRDIEPGELFTGLIKSYNTTVVGFFAELFGVSGKAKPAFAAIGAVACGAALGFWYSASMNAVIVGAAAGLLAALELTALKKPLSKLPAIVQYIYLVIASLVIFGGVYFSSSRGLENWFYSYRKWLLGLVGVNTKYTLSVAMRDMLLHNMTLIVIAFFVVCAPARRGVFRLCDNIAAKSRRSYGAVRIVKTLCTALVFALSIMTLVVEYTR